MSDNSDAGASDDRQKKPDMYLTMAVTRGFFSLAFCTLTLWTVSQAEEHMTSSFWRLIPSQQMVTFQAAIRGRSKVECVMECQTYSHCNSFVFNASSHTCYLLPTLNNVTDGEFLEEQMYIKIDTNCTTDKAPQINGSVVVWKSSLTSLVGEVRCYDDFINSTDDVSVQCMAVGSWQKHGMCLRNVWRNPPLTTFPIDIPFPLVSKWSLCVDGIPTSKTRFSVNLVISPVDMALVMDVRFNFGSFVNKVVLCYYLEGKYFDEQYPSSFPFKLGQPFHLVITASVSGPFQIYVDGSLLQSHPQHPSLPTAAIKAVYIKFLDNVTTVNAWCLP